MYSPERPGLEFTICEIFCLHFVGWRSWFLAPVSWHITPSGSDNIVRLQHSDRMKSAIGHVPWRTHLPLTRHHRAGPHDDQVRTRPDSSVQECQPKAFLSALSPKYISSPFVLCSHCSCLTIALMFLTTIMRHSVTLAVLNEGDSIPGEQQRDSCQGLGPTASTWAHGRTVET